MSTWRIRLRALFVVLPLLAVSASSHAEIREIVDPRLETPIPYRTEDLRPAWMDRKAYSLLRDGVLRISSKLLSAKVIVDQDIDTPRLRISLRRGDLLIFDSTEAGQVTRLRGILPGPDRTVVMKSLQGEIEVFYLFFIRDTYTPYGLYAVIDHQEPVLELADEKIKCTEAGIDDAGRLSLCGRLWVEPYGFGLHGLNGLTGTDSDITAHFVWLEGAAGARRVRELGVSRGRLHLRFSGCPAGRAFPVEGEMHAIYRFDGAGEVVGFSGVGMGSAALAPAEEPRAVDYYSELAVRDCRTEAFAYLARAPGVPDSADRWYHDTNYYPDAPAPAFREQADAYCKSLGFDHFADLEVAFDPLAASGEWREVQTGERRRFQEQPLYPVESMRCRRTTAFVFDAKE